MKKVLRFGRTHIIWLILVGALLLRLPFLNGSFWLDEAAQALESSRPLSQQLDIAEDFQPPLMHIFVHVLTYVSKAEWWLRLSSLSAGLITIWATYFAISMVTNKKIATLTSFFLAISSFHIFYSQELRPYSITAMFAALGWLLAIHITHHTIVKPKLLASFVLITIAGFYSTYLYPFAFLGQLLFLISRRKKHYLTQAGMSMVLTGLAFLPWLPFLRQQLDVSKSLRMATPNWETVVSTPQLKAMQLVFGKFVFGVLDLDVNVAFVGITLVLVGSIACLTWYMRRHLGVFSGLIICCWFILPVFFIWGFSFFLPVLQPKRVLFALPGFYMLISALIVYGWEWKKTKMLSGLLCAAMVAISFFSTTSYYLNSKYHREDWRRIIWEIDENYSASSTIVVFGFDHPFSPWDWYTHQPYKVIVTGTDTKTEYYQIRAPMRPAMEYEQVIVFDYLRDLTDPNRFIETWLRTYNYHQTQLFVDPNIGFVRVFTKGGTFADDTTRNY